MKEHVTLFMEKVASYLFAPFDSWNTFLFAVNGVWESLLNMQTVTAWPYLLSSIVVAYVIYRFAVKDSSGTSPGSFRTFAFPRDIYRHRSAVVDYKYALIDLTIQGIVYVPLISGCSWLIFKLMQNISGGAAVSATSPPNLIVLTLISFLLIDFGYFLAHYCMHRLPLLWYFHEVHHSAEVMTPVTVLRVHPVEKIVTALISTLVGSVGSIAYAVSSDQQVNLVTISGVNIFVFYFRVFAIHLRHSHIWLSYGTILSHILISPAQHQIHHSVDPKHYDKNYGYVLAIWDVLFRSLYVPRQRETLQFGLAGTDPQDFSTVARLYILPFRKAMRHRRTAKPGNPVLVTQAGGGGTERPNLIQASGESD